MSSFDIIKILLLVTYSKSSSLSCSQPLCMLLQWVWWCTHLHSQSLPGRSLLKYFGHLLWQLFKGKRSLSTSSIYPNFFSVIGKILVCPEDSCLLMCQGHNIETMIRKHAKCHSREQTVTWRGQSLLPIQFHCFFTKLNTAYLQTKLALAIST